MNKQELIEKVKRQHTGDMFGDAFKRGFECFKLGVLKDIEKLDEPELIELPVVSKEFDKWVKKAKDKRTVSTWKSWCVKEIANAGWGNWLHDPETEEKYIVDGACVMNNSWTIEVKNDKEKHIKAIYDGYTVKQEPKYIVKLPMVNWNDEASELQDDFAFLILDITSDETRISGSDKDFKTWIARLTEREIKSIDERYWAFAVPVDGSVEEA